MGKRIRIALLLFVLATVAVGAWQARSRTTSWERALDVVVFPINGDQQSATADRAGNSLATLIGVRENLSATAVMHTHAKGTEKCDSCHCQLH